VQVSPELQSDETNAAISDAQAAVEGMLGGRVHLVSTSIGSENGRPDHVYFEEWFEDGSSQMWEYTERGPGGMPELVKARTDKGD